MDENLPTLLPDILKVIKHIIQNASYVLRRTVLQPKGLVNEVVFEILRGYEAYTVEDVSDPILAQDFSVLGDFIAP